MWIAIAVGVLLVAAVALIFLVDANRFRPELESSLTQALNRNVKLGNLSLSILSGSVAANDLEIAEDPAFGKAPFIRAKAFRVGVELWPLIFSRQLNVKGITIDQPEIMLVQNADGRWNYSSLGTSASADAKPESQGAATPAAKPGSQTATPASKPGSQTATPGAKPGSQAGTAPAKQGSQAATPTAKPGSQDATPAATQESQPATAAAGENKGLALTVHKLNINDGQLTLGRTTPNWKPLVLNEVNLEVQEFSPTSNFPFTLSTKIKGGGSIKLDGKAGPINATDASMTPATLKFDIAGVDVAATGLANYVPDMAGLISLQGNGQTDGNIMNMNGVIKAEKLKLSKTGTPATVPVEFTFDADDNMRNHSGVLKRGDVRIGKAPAKITGNYHEQGQNLMLNMNLDAPNMPVSDIVAMLAPLGIVLPSGSTLQGGTIGTKLAANGPADKLVMDGSLGIHDTTLAGFDLGKNMAAVLQAVGMQTGSSTVIQNASANVHVSPEGIAAKNIQLNVPAMGELKGDGTISPANALDFKMSVALHTSGAAAVIANKNIPFFVQGTSAQPVFKPDVKGLANEQIKAVTSDPAGTVNAIKGLLGGKK
jgi:AsmA protein